MARDDAIDASDEVLLSTEYKKEKRMTKSLSISNHRTILREILRFGSCDAVIFVFGDPVMRIGLSLRRGRRKFCSVKGGL